MFEKKPLKLFHISLAHFYVVGQKNETPSRFALRLRSRAMRGVYRDHGVLVAL